MLLCLWTSQGQNTGVGSHSLLQGIFPTQGLNSCLPHCGCILYCLSHQGSPWAPYKCSYHFFFFFLKEMPVSFSSSKGWPCVLFILTLAHSECQLICWTVIFILLALWLSNCKWRESYKQWKVKWPSSVSQWHGVFGSLMSYSFWRRYEKETQPTYCWISPHTDFCEVNYLKSLFLCDPCYEASKFFFRCSVSHQEVKTVEDIFRFSP